MEHRVCAPPSRTPPARCVRTTPSAKAVLSNRRFVGYVVVASSAFIALFAYVVETAKNPPEQFAGDVWVDMIAVPHVPEQRAVVAKVRFVRGH